ncbi:MAG TPA: SHOCT domain-containing protein [Dehalococcoidia bacterium]|jgi:putative membrane protein|nr:SHOCT domain-containing protein [Dehalococcoidia bacterium]
MWYCGVGTGWWAWLGGIWVVLFWGGLIALIVWGIKRLTESSSSAMVRHSPLDIARERYARGEISREELAQIEKDLTQR